MNCNIKLKKPTLSIPTIPKKAINLSKPPNNTLSNAKPSIPSGFKSNITLSHVKSSSYINTCYDNKHTTHQKDNKVSRNSITELKKSDSNSFSVSIRTSDKSTKAKSINRLVSSNDFRKEKIVEKPKPKKQIFSPVVKINLNASTSKSNIQTIRNSESSSSFVQSKDTQPPIRDSNINTSCKGLNISKFIDDCGEKQNKLSYRSLTDKSENNPIFTTSANDKNDMQDLFTDRYESTLPPPKITLVSKSLNTEERIERRIKSHSSSQTELKLIQNTLFSNKSNKTLVSYSPQDSQQLKTIKRNIVNNNNKIVINHFLIEDNISSESYKTRSNFIAEKSKENQIPERDKEKSLNIFSPMLDKIENILSSVSDLVTEQNNVNNNCNYYFIDNILHSNNKHMKDHDIILSHNKRLERYHELFSIINENITEMLNFTNSKPPNLKKYHKTISRSNKLGVINEEEEPMSIKNSQRSFHHMHLYESNNKISSFNQNICSNIKKNMEDIKKTLTILSDDIENYISDNEENISNSKIKKRDISTITYDNNLCEYDGEVKVINSLKKPKEILNCTEGKLKVSLVKPFSHITKEKQVNLTNNSKTKSNNDFGCNIF